MDLDQTQTPSTTVNDQSFGPALVGSSSFDSPALSAVADPDHEEQPNFQVDESTRSITADKTNSNTVDTNLDIEEQQPRISHAVNEIISESQSEASQLVEPEATSVMAPAMTVTGISGDSPLPHQTNFSETNATGDNDGPTLREAQEYANDLAQELINDTNQSVREDHSELVMLASDEAHDDEKVSVSRVDEEKDLEVKEEIMEFTKNYSDDLLMSSTAGQKQHDDQHNSQGGGHDLADFELPAYSGSSGSSASEQQAPGSTTASTTYNITSSSTDLTAIKNILISSYSKFSHVFHWKKPIESGVFLGIGLTLITALTFFSIISVVAYSALGIILASGLMRIYKASMKTLSKSPETPVDHIWEKALNLSVKISPEKMHKMVDASQVNLNASLIYFKQVLLVEDKLATFKFAFFLYMLTYIGAWFNGLTLITITYLSLFTIPLIYEKNKTKIDEHFITATNQISIALSMVTSKTSALVFGSQSSSASKKQN